MADDPSHRRRRTIRLEGFDYARPGAYFVTACAVNRDCLFGDVIGGALCLNDLGKCVQETWHGLPGHYPGVKLDAFVVMPNHVHGIIWLGEGATAGREPVTAPRDLPGIIRAFKSFSARRINELRSTPGGPVWQRGYHDHVVRTEDSLNRIRQYILDNPARWMMDRENPGADAPEPENAWLL